LSPVGQRARRHTRHLEANLALARTGAADSIEGVDFISFSFLWARRWLRRGRHLSGAMEAVSARAFELKPVLMGHETTQKCDRRLVADAREGSGFAWA
jgi:hypothetical protein